MSTIHGLPPEVISAIAAGETIERPAFVIKELVENALDAKADQITITFSQAGLEHIRVYDNGIGMSAEDIALSVQPHTTSKISQLADLDALTTFGFRGEALASMGKVALLTVASKQRPASTQESSNSGNLIQVHHGAMSQVSPYAMTPGTIVVVEHLFAQVPVRRKFLTNLHKERRLILDVVGEQALSHPEVGFQLRDGLKILLDLPTGQTLPERLSFLLNQDTISQLLPFSFTHQSLSFNGYLGTPQLARKQTKQQHLFINRRVITYPLINATIKKAYGTLLAPGFAPWFLLNLTMPSALFDANVHPRKETVAFLDEATICTLISTTVRDSLAKQNLGWQYTNPAVSQPAQASFSIPTKQSPLAEVHQVLRSEITPWSVKELNANGVLQVANTYLIYPDSTGFTIIDQHAAHERILYEQFKSAYEEQLTTQQSFAVEPPHILNLTPAEDLAWQAENKTLKQIGFDWEPFGPHSYAIHVVPASLQDHDLDQVIPQLLDDIAAKQPVGLTNQAHRTLAYLACRSAVMAGDPMSQIEAERLIVQLSQTKNNATCPHGRPTRIHFAEAKLASLFKRK